MSMYPLMHRQEGCLLDPSLWQYALSVPVHWSSPTHISFSDSPA